MRLKLLLLFSILGGICSTNAQKITILTQHGKESFRGLSVVNDSIAWVSGTHGNVGKSIDHGKTWEWFTISECDKCDFRSIQAFDNNTAIVVAIDTPSFIFKTKDGGKTWNKVWESHTSGMFLDACHFVGKNGYVIGDPVDGQIFTLETMNQGETWKPVQIFAQPQTNEAFFASSASNIVFSKKIAPIAVSGGEHASLFYKKKSYRLPITQGKTSTGANSIVLNNNKLENIAAIIVGGDFMNKESSDSNIVLVKKSFFLNPNVSAFQLSKTPPKGYKSSVTQINNETFIATGTSGTDISNDEGVNWKHISDQPFHVIQSVFKGNWIVLAGPNGIVANLSF
ncbi:WD40/YVTN/BNR-like repeat-containing protein [Rhizosphaericola mali]|uniref:Oxidoreductase n=1 Tax=Rhizosphaericola mali TaxID=2545455 RepID=A0A5P2G1A9_9BACT|nr:oxidoreductase [Rhizosphaericola mali]QES89215.1 oxidoreductase [Rhizosphaericola mali]